MREPGPSYARCTVRARPRPSIDWERARDQHRAVAATLAAIGAKTQVLDALDAFPDSVFVEDTALIVDRIAVLCPFAVPARAGEERAIEAALRAELEVCRLARGTLDGGDCLVTDDAILVGLSARSDLSACDALRSLCERNGTGHVVRPVAVPDARLHLKCVASYLGTACGAPTILAATRELELGSLHGYRVVDARAGEEAAANCVAIGCDVVVDASAPRTAELLDGLGYRVHPVDISELAKGDGSISCLSLLWRA